MKKIVWRISITAIILIGVVVVYLLGTSNERVSQQFAEHLFEYPLPPETSLIAKHQFNGKNFVDGGGSGGYWNVAAIMELSSTITKNEILAYYQNVEPFPYPNGESDGVELEIYFEENGNKKVSREGFYYRENGYRIRTISSYLEETSSQDNKASESTKYILQITSGFDYFFNID